jgi:hypothetical protein
VPRQEPGLRVAAICSPLAPARPPAEAKADAWRIAVESEDTPNETQFRTILGFQQPGQEDLLRPYVGRRAPIPSPPARAQRGAAG